MLSSLEKDNNSQAPGNIGLDMAERGIVKRDQGYYTTRGGNSYSSKKSISSPSPNDSSFLLALGYSQIVSRQIDNEQIDKEHKEQPIRKEDVQHLPASQRLVILSTLSDIFILLNEYFKKEFMK